MGIKIHIDAEPFSETRYYSGIYSSEDQPDEEYGLTLAAQLDENSNVMFVMEVTWTDERPQDSQEIEKQIKEHWEKEK